MVKRKLIYHKELVNYVRWDYIDADGIKFEFLIPKYRIPSPCPRMIWVTLLTIEEDVPIIAKEHDSDKQKPIVVIVRKFSKRTKTIRYQQLEKDYQKWEIGEPYIPISLLPRPLPEQLRIVVEWDYSIGNIGSFDLSSFDNHELSS